MRAPHVRTLTVALLLAACLRALLSAPQAHAAWPPDWPFLRSEEGWFFYKDPPRPRPPAPADVAPQEEREPVTPPPPEAESQEDTETTAQPPKPEDASITFSITADDDLKVAPVSGPALEGWLLKRSDRDLERLVSKAPAAALRNWIPVLLDQALTRLNRPSVRKYLLAQQESLRRSDRFSKLWQEIIWTDPTFDRPGQLPVSSIAQAIHQESQAASRAARLRAIAPTLALLIIVGPDCRPCEAQWEIAKRWAHAGGMTARPIAKELLTLADGTLAMPYPQIIASLQLTELPATYLSEPGSGHLVRLGSGLLTEEELTTRIIRLIPEPPNQPLGGVQHVSTPSLSTSADPLPPGEEEQDHDDTDAE